MSYLNNRIVVFLYFVIILVLGGYLSFHNLNGAIEHTDEAMHMTVVQEMLQTGEYFPPKAQGQYYFNKPPLKMLLTLPVIKLFGDYNYTYRLIDGFCGLVSLLLIFYLSKLLFESWTAGFIAVLFLLGNSVLFGPHIFRAAVQDSAAFCLNLLALITGIYLIELGTDKQKMSSDFRKKLILAVLCAFLILCSFMTKLIVAFIPIALLIIYALCEKKLVEFIRNNKTAILLGLVVFIVIPVVYYVYLHSVYQHIWGYMQRQTYGRLVTEGQHNKDDLFFYFRLLFKNQSYGSAVLFVMGLLGSIWAWFKNRNSKVLFVIVWTLLIICGFSALRARLDYYLSPVFPAMGLVVGYGIEWFVRYLNGQRMLSIQAGRKSRSVCWGVGLVGVIGGFIGLSSERIIRVREAVRRDWSQTPLNTVADQIITLKDHDPSWRIVSYEFNLNDGNRFLSLKLFAKEDYVYANRIAGVIETVSNREEVPQRIKDGKPTLLLTSEDGLGSLRTSVGVEDCQKEFVIRHKKDTETMIVTAYNNKKSTIHFCEEVGSSQSRQ